MGYQNVITRSRHDLDLTNQNATRQFLMEVRPKYVFHAAAKVGGIGANSAYPATFISENLLICSNVITSAHAAGVERLLFLGSSCIYPRLCPQPIKEEYLLTGPLEETNAPYAIAKISGMELCRAHNKQYGTDFRALMPTNLYGPSDRYEDTTSHVIPAIIRKMHIAKIKKVPEVELWGSGRPLRDFLHSDDLAAAAILVMTCSREEYRRKSGTPAFINVGSGVEITIAELAEIIRGIVQYDGATKWNVSMPDGTPRKLLNIERIRSFGWSPRIDLYEGVRAAYKDYIARFSHTI